MAIACVYCGGEHGSASDVRRCWQDHEGVATVPATDTPIEPPNAPAPRLPRAPAPTVPRAAAPARPGPRSLGRWAIVAGRQRAPVPWDDAPRIVIDHGALGDVATLVADLRRHAMARERVVIELGVDVSLDAESSTSDIHRLTPTFAFDIDALAHLIETNAVDLRTDTPTWWVLDLAVAAGCTPVPTGEPGDVELADGRRAWIDGGPLRALDPIDDLPVIHRVALEHGAVEPPLSNTSTAALAPDQLAAVTHAGGAARIIAPAGSGKTRVLTERARHLVQRWRLPAPSVCLVAFNKRAQIEMEERTADLPGLQVRTLNSLALAIVNGTRPFQAQPTQWRTIDEMDVRKIIGDLVAFPRRRNSDPVAPWIEALSLIRLGLVDPDDAEQSYDGDVDGLAAVWPQFRARLEQMRAVDFDDQIYRALQVLLTQPDARRAAQRACRVLLVDEFQDLTPAHVLMIRLLAAPDGSIFGVGDDDQTIYGYNGADPSWLIEFDKLVPGAGSHPLEVNYRCPPAIVGAVDRLLRHNRRRVSKTIRPSSTDPDGLVIDPSPDPVSATLRVVTDGLAAGTQPNEIAVLTRVNALLAPVQVALVGAGVTVNGGVGPEFLRRSAVGTVLSWLRLATGTGRFADNDLREALRRPSRSFHPRITDWISEQSSLEELRRLSGRLNNDKDSGKLLDFVDDISTMRQAAERGGSTSALLDLLIDDIGLAGAVNTLDAHRRGMNRAAQGDDLTALAHLARLHDDPATFASWLADRLSIERSSAGVTLATVHRVKGQEWPLVAVHLADAHQYPHRLAEDVEEERRLFHVALTRASRQVVVVTGPEPSPFVDELDREPSESEPVELHAPTPTRSAPPRPTTSGLPAAVEDLDDAAQARYLALGELRHELRDGKPAYVVYDNKTAVALAASAPTTRAALLAIPGIGPAKLERYGDAIITLMKQMSS